MWECQVSICCIFLTAVYSGELMKVIRKLTQLRCCLKQANGSIGFVPTMGFFHEGHLALMRRAKKETDICVVSIFVNPMQFGPREDLACYPRDEKRDMALACSAGVDVLFIPSVNEVYPGKMDAQPGAPEGFTFVEVPGVSEMFCGDSRPGHFRGVATVVAKLLNMVQPDKMYLGHKDAQQVFVLQSMVKDLNIPVQIVVCPTVREADGLAMSSRNKFLSATERVESASMFRALTMARKMITAGEFDAVKIISQIKKLIADETDATIDYVACVKAETFRPVTQITDDVYVLLAVKFSSARLIDNDFIKVARRKKSSA